MRERIGITDAGALAGLFVNPSWLDLKASGDLGGGEYFVHGGIEAPFVQSECKAGGKSWWVRVNYGRQNRRSVLDSEQFGFEKISASRMLFAESFTIRAKLGESAPLASLRQIDSRSRAASLASP